MMYQITPTAAVIALEGKGNSRVGALLRRNHCPLVYNRESLEVEPMLQ